MDRSLLSNGLTLLPTSTFTTRTNPSSPSTTSTTRPKGHCSWIHGLDFSSNEDEGVLEKVEKYYSDMGIEFNQNEIDRAHYIGNSYMNKKKNKVRSTIVKQPFTKPNQETI